MVLQKEPGFRVRGSNPGSSLSCCVASGKLLHCSELLVPHLRIRARLLQGNCKHGLCACESSTEPEHASQTMMSHLCPLPEIQDRAPAQTGGTARHALVRNWPSVLAAL